MLEDWSEAHRSLFEEKRAELERRDQMQLRGDDPERSRPL
jgi:hypothetical protein